MIENNNVYYAHADHLNTPVALTNQNQAVVWNGEYQPFGEVDEVIADIEFNLRRPGQYADRETGLYQNWHRYLDPEIGRYTGSDPIGLRGGLNTYGYALQNPNIYFDPDGLEVRFMCRSLAGAAGDMTGKKHCFVFVSCPSEGWSRVLSLFASNKSAGFPTEGRKSMAAPGTPGMRDNPNSQDITDDHEIKPAFCPDEKCAYEKDVINRFLNFPSGSVPYFPLGPNSNSFAEQLITSPDFGTSLPPGVQDAPGFGHGWP